MRTLGAMRHRPDMPTFVMNGRIFARELRRVFAFADRTPPPIGRQAYSCPNIQSHPSRRTAKVRAGTKEPSSTAGRRTWTRLANRTIQARIAPSTPRSTHPARDPAGRSPKRKTRTSPATPRKAPVAEAKSAPRVPRKACTTRAVEAVRSAPAAPRTPRQPRGWTLKILPTRNPGRGRPTPSDHAGLAAGLIRQTGLQPPEEMRRQNAPAPFPQSSALVLGPPAVGAVRWLPAAEQSNDLDSGAECVGGDHGRTTPAHPP